MTHSILDLIVMTFSGKTAMMNSFGQIRVNSPVTARHGAPEAGYEQNIN